MSVEIPPYIEGKPMNAPSSKVTKADTIHNNESARAARQESAVTHKSNTGRWWVPSSGALKAGAVVGGAAVAYQNRDKIAKGVVAYGAARTGWEWLKGAAYGAGQRAFAPSTSVATSATAPSTASLNSLGAWGANAAATFPASAAAGTALTVPLAAAGVVAPIAAAAQMSDQWHPSHSDRVQSDFVFGANDSTYKPSYWSGDSSATYYGGYQGGFSAYDSYGATNSGGSYFF